MSSSLVVRGRVVVTRAGERPLRDAAVEIADGRVVRVRPVTDGEDGPSYDVLLPGLIDAHSHARGLPVVAHGLSGHGPLERYIVELRALTPLAAGDEAIVAAADGLGTGITTTQVIHHTFAGPAAYAAAAHEIAAGYAAGGARAAIALTITDQHEYTPWAVDGVASPARGVGVDGFAAIFGDLAGSSWGDGRVIIDALGPVGPQWCSDRALTTIAALRDGWRVHCHLFETRRQGMAPDGDPLARLDAAGLLTGRTSVAHGIWLDERQTGRFADAGAVVIHCPGSNRRLGVGHCRVRELLSAGIPVALGLDSHGIREMPDAFAEMRAALDESEALGAPLGPQEVLALATLGGARALCRDDLGVLEPGAQADVVALDLPTAVDASDPVAEVVTRGQREDVVAVWVSGVEPASAAQADAARARLWRELDADAQRRAARVEEASRSAGRVEEAWRDWERGPSGRRTTVT